MRGLTFKTYKDKKKIGIKDGILKLQKTLGIYKAYGNNFYKV